MIKRGSTGAAVVSLQIELARLGYDIQADGVFGAKTQRAVALFQQSAGLTQNGIVNAATQTELIKQAESDGIRIPKTAHFDMAMFISPEDERAVKCGIPVMYWNNLQMLMTRLESVQTAAGFPLVVRSGYRSAGHNRDVGGATRSQHLLGGAADIFVKDYVLSCYSLARMIIDDPALCGLFGGLGLGSVKNVHVDIRKKPNPQKPTLWWYTHKTWKAWSRA